MKVVTTVYRHADLLPHFLKHYQQQGGDTFLIGVHGGKTSPCWEQVQAATSAHPCVCVESYCGEFSTGQETACKQRLCEQFISPEEWWAAADLDEFHEYPLPQSRWLREAERLGCDHVLGHLLDRVAADGSLPSVAAGDIGKQYPYITKLTEKILGGQVQKVMLGRGHRQLGLAHHWVQGGKPFPQTGRVHHFKWNGRVLERLEERHEVLARQQASWSVESERFWEYWRTHGRIDLSDGRLEPKLADKISVSEHDLSQLWAITERERHNTSTLPATGPGADSTT